MYLTSFIHRKELFDIAGRWFCGRPNQDDARLLTAILICDGFVINETLETMAKRLIGILYDRPLQQRHIRTKGEFRDIICSHDGHNNPRVAELLANYRNNPDYYYREAPINAAVYLGADGQILGAHRIKRPKRIAEKANRRIADWIFEKVLGHARELALQRAESSGVQFEHLLTSPEEMRREFIQAEEFIAGSFKKDTIRLDKSAMTIHDVGAIKIISAPDGLKKVETAIRQSDDMKIIECENFRGNYQATSLILDIPWDPGTICRLFRERRAWEQYQDRGIPAEILGKGLEPFLEGAEPNMNIEVILTTFPDLVESEFGSSIHEERIAAQRDNRRYRGYIPMNVEFIVESLFAVGFSPRIDINMVPIKLWGRYLPETMSSFVRSLYNLPEHDLIR